MVADSATHQLVSLDDPLELRPFPAAASQLMSACEKQGITTKEIADIIKHDPALSLKLLQVANSPLYGFSGDIRSVDHAAVILGFRTVKDLAVSLAIGDVFAGGCESSAKARQQLWIHSLSCGCFASLLAEKTKQCTADEAFLAGVLHDVGKLLLLDHSFEHYERICREPNCSTMTAEKECFGVDHASIGQRSGEQWGLPDEISEAIGFHHQPEEADFAAELVSVVAVANDLAHAWFSEAVETIDTVNGILRPLDVNLSERDLNAFHEEAMKKLAAVVEAYS